MPPLPSGRAAGCRRIDDVLDAGLGRRGDRVAMLGEAPAGLVERVGRDEEQTIDTGEGAGERGRVVEIGAAQFRTLCWRGQ